MLSTKLLAKIDEIAKLEENWNGYGSMPISNNVIRNLKTVLDCLPFEPNLFPTGRNSVQMEYFANIDKDGVEIEIFNDFASYDLIRNGDYIIEDETITIEDAVALLLDFYYR